MPKAFTNRPADNIQSIIECLSSSELEQKIEELTDNLLMQPEVRVAWPTAISAEYKNVRGICEMLQSSDVSIRRLNKKRGILPIFSAIQKDIGALQEAFAGHLQDINHLILKKMIPPVDTSPLVFIQSQLEQLVHMIDARRKELFDRANQRSRN